MTRPKWAPFDRPLTESELNYRHRAEQPSDFELERERTNPDVVRLLQSDAPKDERPTVDTRERRGSDAPKGAQQDWFGVCLGRGESLRLQAEPALNHLAYFERE